jgi:subtilase family serine protease
MPKSALQSAGAGAVALLASFGGLALMSAPAPSTSALAEPMIHAEPAVDTQPAGLGPAQIQAAYGLSTSPYAGIGQTIAIVDAFDNPNVVTDLTTFDTFLGLPPCDASCFTKVDQNGGSDYPSQGTLNWSLEIALDVEWAHAIAPAAHILLVEADNASLPNLLAAEQYAGTHASYVSNSWGFPEFSGETADASYFSEPGVSYFAAVADSAGKTQYPATSPNVVAVGGSELTSTGTVPWSDGGGGCSVYEETSATEADLSTAAGCSGNKSTPEVSADAVGVLALDTAPGWITTGGTSFATVLWTAVAADSGRVVTSADISSGLIPLHPVVGATLLQTGFGDLAKIPLSAAQIMSMVSAEIYATI